MQLTITSKAEEKLIELNNKQFNYLQLWYDIEDCGCGVNGVPTIRLTNKKETYDKNVAGASFPTIVSEQQAVFFAENMKLDYINHSFRLSSTSEMLNPFIPERSLLNY
ncbi:iron-sulfur cluster biosynthesis family protein [Oceanobacillus bengalensis]|uniref:iron-sulfur cluster biosynthesis family protein n=1 Tax=Oceanobacillus bengalensis TaxID=1435466 RepID=UPI001600D35E|nr:iron-sulfur cluster biosynthesis family protein [Oceanobacillus bengalensis]